MEAGGERCCCHLGECCLVCYDVFLGAKTTKAKKKKMKFHRILAKASQSNRRQPWLKAIRRKDRTESIIKTVSVLTYSLKCVFCLSNVAKIVG